MTERLALDDLQGHARASWRIAGEVCTCDGDYHRIHPLLRAITVMPGIASDRTALNALLPELVGAGSSILIAGAADATLLHYFVTNSDARPLSISMVDRCPAPMRLIDLMALPAGVTVDTRQVDLTRFDDRDRYDLILSHSMLPFASGPARIEILRRLGGSLTANGRLVIVVRVEPPVDRSVREDLTEAWLRKTRAKLADFPQLVEFCGEELPAALENNARQRVSHGNKLHDEAEVRDLIESAGLRLVQHAHTGAGPMVVMPDGSPRRQSGHIFIVAR